MHRAIPPAAVPLPLMAVTGTEQYAPFGGVLGLDVPTSVLWSGMVLCFVALRQLGAFQRLRWLRGSADRAAPSVLTPFLTILWTLLAVPRSGADDSLQMMPSSPSPSLMGSRGQGSDCNDERGVSGELVTMGAVVDTRVSVGANSEASIFPDVPCHDGNQHRKLNRLAAALELERNALLPDVGTAKGKGPARSNATKTKRHFVDSSSTTRVGGNKPRAKSAITASLDEGE